MHFVDGLGRLRRDAEARAPLQTSYVLLGQHYIELSEIFGQPTHLDMVALPDEDRMKALRDELDDSPMGELDQRTGGFDNSQATLANAAQGFLRGAVRGNHHGGGGNVGDLVLGSYSLRTKILEDRLIVHQVAQNCDRPWLAQGQVDGVADAETHAEVGSAKDFHWVWCGSSGAGSEV